MTIQSYAIAAGNDSAGSLTNIESISVANATKITVQGTQLHYFVDAVGRYDVPFRYNAQGLKVQQGYASITWTQSIMSSVAFKYLVDTYEGLVTITTRLYDDNTAYANYNAILELPQPATLARVKMGNELYFGNVDWVLKIIEAL